MSLYKRDMKNNGKFIIGEWSTPELKYLKDNEWVFTEKVDGTNIRVMWNGKNVIFGGRSDNAQLYVKLLLRLQELFMTMESLKLFSDNFGTEEVDVVFYGEGHGAKIQKGGGNYIPDGVDFVLFDVAVNGLYLERENVEDIAKKFGISVVPIIGNGTLKDAIEMTKKGFKSVWGDFVAEGIVVRPRTELRTRRGDRVITKIKYKDFN